MKGILTSSAEVDVAKVESAQKTRYLDNKVRAMLREIVWQVIMFVLFTWVIVGPLDSNVYYQNQDIRNAFIEDAEVHAIPKNFSILFQTGNMCRCIDQNKILTMITCDLFMSDIQDSALGISIKLEYF